MVSRLQAEYCYCFVAQSDPTHRVSCSVMYGSLWPHDCSLLVSICPWDFLGRNTGVGCHCLLQGIFLTQILNLHWTCIASVFFTAESPGKSISEAYLYNHCCLTANHCEIHEGCTHLLRVLSPKTLPTWTVRDSERIKWKKAENSRSSTKLETGQ